MAQILDINTPSVNPVGAPPNDYLRIQANPAAFGALKGQAFEKLGGAVEKTGQDLTQIAEFQGRINVDDQTNKFIDARNRLQYGDPGKTVIGPDGQPTVDRGFMGLEGRAASDAREGTLKALEEARQAGRNNLRSPMEQLAYDSQTRRIYAEAEQHIGAHTQQQWTTWAGGVNAAGAEHELTGWTNNLDNPEAATGYAHNYINFKVQQAQLKFGDDANIKAQAEADAKRDLLQAQVDRVAVRDPKRAIEILDSNKNTAGVKYDDMYNRLRTRADAQTGAQIASDAIQKSRGGNFSAPVNNSIANAAERYGIDPATLRRAAQIESGGNPNIATGSYKGLFQLSQGEFNRYGPAGGSIWNPNDNALAAAAKMKAEGDQFARNFGREPTGFDSYMIHQQGLAGYSTHLANPNAPAWQNMLATGEGREKGERWARQAIWDNIPDQYKAMFGSVDNVTSRDFIAMWAAKFGSAAPAMAQTGGAPASGPSQFRFPEDEAIYGGQGRGAYEAGRFAPPNTAAAIKPSVIQQVLDNPEARANPEIMTHALHAANQTLAAQEIAENQKSTQLKQVAEQTADGYVRSLADMERTGNPDYVGVSAKIAADPHLNYETRKALLDRVAHISGGEGQRDIKTYGNGFYEAFQRINLPQGDPNRITDPAELYPDLGTNLTMSGLEKLRQEIYAKRTPEGEAEAEMKRQFLKSARSQITGTDEGMHLKDPKGDALYLKFMADVLPAYDKGRKEGKSATQLLNPDSNDYIGKSITRFKRPMDQWFSDMVHDNAAGPAAPEAPATPRFDPTTVKALPDLQAAVKAGSIDRAQAIDLAMQRGWIRGNPSPPSATPTVHVPLSQ